MKRRVFEEHGFDVSGKVVSLNDFKLFCDRKDGLVISDEIKAQALKQADEVLTREIPTLYATEYMLFRKNGNRSIYEKKFFERREAMFTLALAEYIEKSGNYTDKLCDYVWLILEETSWVVPAHNKMREGENGYLTYAFKETVDYIDLFSAYTGACLAFVYYLCKDVLNQVTPLICERIIYELDRRIIKSFLSDSPLNHWWMGKRTGGPNNWDPWITSNILTVTALTVEDMQTREEVVKTAIESLDNFTAVYYPDGGCDEGPSYWRVAGGALYNACLALYDITGGYVDVFHDPLIVSIAEYVAKAYICDDYFTNFADAPAVLAVIDHWQLDFAELCGSELMISYEKYRIGGHAPIYAGAGHNCPYRLLRAYAHGVLPKSEFTPPKTIWLDGIGVAVTRETDEIGKGLYLAVKGGHNAESHNHNDVGSFIAFSDNKPILIDLGVGEYTRKTFSSQRYEILSMRSEYHNLPTFNGVFQKNGRAYEAKDYKYDEKSGALKMELSAAYPQDAKLASYTRRAALEDGKISVRDSFTLKENGNAVFNLICRVKPVENGTQSLIIDGKTLSFAPALSYTLEEIDCSEVETANILTAWHTDKLWRIKLIADALEADKEYSFEITLE